MKNPLKNRGCLLGLLSIFTLVSLPASATETNVYVIDFAKNIQYSLTASNGLKLGYFSYTPPPYTVEQPIELAFKYPNGFTIYIPKNEHVGQFALYDSNNIPLPKTALGESFKLESGLQWDRKLVRQDGHGGPDLWHGFQNFHADDEWILFDGWSSLVDFPKINELFKIEKPGKYRLVLEVQVFLKTGLNKNLVRFPPLEIPVIQPENTNSPTNAPSTNQK